ncbi:MAG: HDOD domain-containing protein [Proteobacteria bacterium]|nr:HDOD domain-containing protein [Pseudomonadota bacterium]
MVSSSFYGFPSKIDTVSRAVTLIGTREVRDLALATYVMSLFRDIPADLVSMESFWRHSIACGITARSLAGLRHDDQPETYFVAGLLHDIGRLVIYLNIPDQGRESLLQARSSQQLLYVTEREVLGFDHASVGGALLRAWKLPVSLIEAAMFHHEPVKALREPMPAAMVHVADIIVHSMGLGSSGGVFVPPLTAGAWERLGLSSGVLPAVIRQVELRYETMVQLFKKFM